ncbi:hypothetical protein BCR43DRAFT_481315 [Syncephalastrum racemosum]|uniref:Uncharacterized protein n=1 Tax=Syncephalastrum racemosum TaxID=13706 RepID=A0A1X2HRT5_SYNRA|nr:hypothetical protein BCR43DRAFT_481315 [Syncephalastrum racemosum]
MATSPRPGRLNVCLVFCFLLLLLSSSSLLVKALPVFDADLAANPFVHDSRLSATVDRQPLRKRSVPAPPPMDIMMGNGPEHYL